MKGGEIVIPSNMPVGFRFHPTDEELITHYLRLKLLGRDSEVDPVIAEIDISNYEPWHLPSVSKIRSEDRAWWFFCRRDSTYRSSKRAKRKTESGFWKVTGVERKIKAKLGHGGTVIGTKRTLVFYIGSSPGTRTNWVMQEYCASHLPLLNLPQPLQRDYVICRLKLKSDEAVENPNNNGDEGEPSGEVSDFENPVTCVTIPAEVNAEAPSNIGSAIQQSGQEMSLILQNDVPTTLDCPTETQALRDDDESEESASQFADSLIIDPNEVCYNIETTHFVSNISSLPGPSKRAYYQGVQVSTDSDSEGGYERHIQSLASLRPLGSPGVLRRARQKRIIKTCSETSQTLKNDNFISQNVPPQQARNLKTTVKPTLHKREVNCLNMVMDNREKRIQASKKLSCSTTFGNSGREAFDPRQKEISVGEFETGSGSMVQRSYVKKHSGFSESTSESNSDPPAKCWFNAVLGAVLFAVFARELVMYGWCN